MYFVSISKHVTSRPTRIAALFGRRFWSCGCAVLALSAAPALAQTEAGTTGTARPPAATASKVKAKARPATDATAKKPQQNSGLEQITVNARRRSEPIERTPISMTTVTGSEFTERGITSIARIQDMAPNMMFGNVASNAGVANAAAIFIRGIGQTDFSFGVDPGVGLYIDGVYAGNTVGSVLDMIDVSNVSVLRGPQGTLFGRNTIGGAVTVSSLTPNDRLSAKADVKYGTANRINARAFINVPLTRNLFMNFSVGSFMQDGYVNQPYAERQRKMGNQDTRIFKGAVLWRPVDKLTVTLRGDYTRDRSNGAPYVVIGIDPTLSSSVVALNNITAGASKTNWASCTLPGCYGSKYFSKTTNYSTAPNYSNIESWSASATIDYEFSHYLEVKSITAVHQTTGQFAQDRDSSPIAINDLWDGYSEKQVSEEFQVMGRALSNRLHYAAGLYYFNQSGADINPGNKWVEYLESGGYFKDINYAAYAQATYSLTRKLSITAGVRYTEDDKTFLPDQYIVWGRAPYVTAPPGTRIVPYENFHNNNARWTPMVNVAYQIAPELMAYSTFSQGFKGGGFTQRLTKIANAPPSFKPESVNSFEGGLKFYGLDHRLRVSASGFYVFYDDVQLLVSDAATIGPYYTNAGSARIPGFELEAQYALGDGWMLTGSLGMTDAHYTKLTAKVSGLTLNSKFAMVSKWTANAGVSKTISIGRAGTLTPRVDASYRSRYNADVNSINYAPLFQPKYILVNASLRWVSPDARYNFQAGVDNISNEKYMHWGSFSASVNNFMASYDRGRQWYIQGGVSF